MSRVAVTGLGALTPLGPDVAALTEGLLSGRSGVRVLEGDSGCSGIQWEALPARLAATVDTEGRLERVEARTLDRVQQLALIAAREAWQDAGAPEVEPTRLAVVIGSGIGGALTLLSQYDVLQARGPRSVSPHLVPMLMPNGPAATVGLELKARAGVHTPVSACASGAEAIAQALTLLRAGEVDVACALTWPMSTADTPASRSAATTERAAPSPDGSGAVTWCASAARPAPPR
jgi:3-oxoacyl-[acyl-carrier-protein] synthase II